LALSWRSVLSLHVEWGCGGAWDIDWKKLSRVLAGYEGLAVNEGSGFVLRAAR
jgi:hypothetical protein